MKRLWIGVILLVVLLGIGLGLLWGSCVFFKDFCNDLEQADTLALAGNWPAAREKAAKSQALWEQFHDFWSSFTDHEPMEQVENLFSQLDLYGTQQSEVDFSAVCRSLIHIARAIEESHSLRWWSIL